MSRILLSPTKWEYAPASVLGEAHAHGAPDARTAGWGWTPCKSFPTEIHDELRAAGRIGDWNKGRVEHDVQCELPLS
jgi:beta-mannosidase